MRSTFKNNLREDHFVFQFILQEGAHHDDFRSKFGSSAYLTVCEWLFLLLLHLWVWNKDNYSLLTSAFTSVSIHSGFMLLFLNLCWMICDFLKVTIFKRYMTSSLWRTWLEWLRWCHLCSMTVRWVNLSLIRFRPEWWYEGWGWRVNKISCELRWVVEKSTSHVLSVVSA